MKMNYLSDEDKIEIDKILVGGIDTLKTMGDFIDNKYIHTKKCISCNNTTATRNSIRCIDCKKQLAKNKSLLYKNKTNYTITPKAKYTAYLKGAISRNYTFNLSFDEFMLYWNKQCYYCNSDISTIGLDRIDNNIGYTTTNIVSCCFTCNSMKRSSSYKEFILKCITIAEKHKDNL